MTRWVLAATLAAAIAVGTAAASGGPSLLHPASLHAKAPATFSATFKTTKGSFVITVTRDWAPNGADRFYNLVLNHFYDNQPVFRVIPGFVAQWGISGKPAIAKAWRYAYIKTDPATHSDAKGTVAFAIAGNDKTTRTTQVFVNLGSNNLGPSFPAFGTVTSGLSVVKRLYHGYGEYASNNQSGITKYGASWVHKYFPKLDWIKTARLVS